MTAKVARAVDHLSRLAPPTRDYVRLLVMAAFKTGMDHEQEPFRLIDAKIGGRKRAWRTTADERRYVVEALRAFG